MLGSEPIESSRDQIEITPFKPSVPVLDDADNSQYADRNIGEELTEIRKMLGINFSNWGQE